MGRPKSYDREEILERAMLLFWRRGYEATSTADLEEGMGVNRYSLYAEFDSKHGLYEAALDRYLTSVVPGFLGELYAPDADLDAVVAVLGRFADAAGKPGTERGCMICNAATETSPDDVQVRARVERYVAYLRGGFEHALGGAVASRSVRTDLDVEAWSARLATTLLGVFVLIRAQLDGAVARGAVHATLSELRGVQTASA
jgi:TetR/AcrR family transcriptional repressor of nem operon